MSGIDDYNRQLAILSQLRSEMQNVRARFDAARRTYSDQIAAAAQQKYMGDYVEQLGARYQEFSGLLDDLLMEIARGEAEIGEQEQRVNRARSAALQQA